MQQRVLFLDIDGVFIPRRMYNAPNQTKPLVTTFDPGVVGMVNELCDEHGYKLVIHSSWLRTSLIFLQDKGGADTVHGHMLNQGLKPEYFHEDHSCTYRFSGTRWLAIAEWLDRHPEVSDYWILEDEPCDYHYRDVFKDRCITTNFDEGLTYAQAQYIAQNSTGNTVAVGE